MKKLMFAVAAVALASVATAATTKWSFGPGGALKDGYIRKDTSKTSSDTVAISGASAYLFDAAKVSYGGQTGQTALLLALAAGEDIADYAVMGKIGGTGDAVAIAATTGTDGKVASTSAAHFTSEDYALNQVVGFFTAVTATDAAGNKFVYLSASKDTTALDPAQEQSIGPALGMSTNYRGDGKEFGSAGWYQYAAAPEPTSGLLLLLGVGALALRRRRA